MPFEGMKFYIGGGWFTFHHEKHAAGSVERGAWYYSGSFKLLPGAEGITWSPGRGYEVKEEVWWPRTTALIRWPIGDAGPISSSPWPWGCSTTAYREMLHKTDDKRTFWWWCWGDPVHDHALCLHPLIVRWHTVVQMSGYHGSTQPPGPNETALTGSRPAHPGMGYGNS